mgnify:CR=1 FL=1
MATRKLTRQTIRPVLHYTRVNVNSGFYKWYHFTLDYYGDKPSFQGGAAYDLDGCYAVPRYDRGETRGKPFDQYAINLETGDVLDLATGEIVMRDAQKDRP